jgi:serine/threonine-protein kinase
VSCPACCFAGSATTPLDAESNARPESIGLGENALIEPSRLDRTGATIAARTAKTLSDINLGFGRADGSGKTLTMLRISTLTRLGRERNSKRTPSGVPVPSYLVPGQELGSYRLLECLGRGAQGEVWKARQLEPAGGLVALKVLAPSSAQSATRIAQFRREAERGLRLVGPSLLTIQELAASDGHHFMTMPFVEGTSLRDVIKSRIAYLSCGDPAPLHPIVSLDENEYLCAMTHNLAEATRAIARVHDQRIAHRDIKPANILLDNRRSGGVYLCDFGLGRDLDYATPDQMRDGAGTPLYMAPERLLKLPADEIKCDIYSMGVTLYEALTLERPFRVPNHVGPAGLAAFLALAEPGPPRVVSHLFPDEVQVIVMKAMARDPRDRHESAFELATELERFAHGWMSRRSHVTARELRQPRVRRAHVFSRAVVARRQAGSNRSADFSDSSCLGPSLGADPINDFRSG